MSIRRQLRILQCYAAASFVAAAFLFLTAFARQSPAQRIDELTVERLNIVEPDGTLRVVLSDRARMHPGVIDGVTMQRTRPIAGMIFFNDEGDEQGGLTFAGTDKGGRRAQGELMFDQLKQDQTIGINYNEDDGVRTAGLQVWDRSDRPLSDLIRAANAANALPPGPQRETALMAAAATAAPGPRRVFVGKNTDRSASVSLADANGRPRLVMTVAADGTAAIDFRDANGKIVQHIPASK